VVGSFTPVEAIEMKGSARPVALFVPASPASAVVPAMQVLARVGAEVLSGLR
jgi:hypothetical protein